MAPSEVIPKRGACQSLGLDPRRCISQFRHTELPHSMRPRRTRGPLAGWSTVEAAPSGEGLGAGLRWKLRPSGEEREM